MAPLTPDVPYREHQFHALTARDGMMHVAADLPEIDRRIRGRLE